MKATLIFLSLFFLSSAAMASAWPAENTWNPEWETRYSNWVRQNWKDDVFMNPQSLLYGIETDCAKAAYSMRALFSYLNHLELRVHTVDPATITSSLTARFDRIKNPDQRFRTFLKWMLPHVNSTTLGIDTYPVKMDRAHVVPGTVYVSPGSHSFQIIDLTDAGVPVTLNSTVPIEQRYLYKLVGFPFYMPHENGIGHGGGYKAFREPQQLEWPVRQIANADFGQYELNDASHGNFFDFSELLRQRLALRDENPSEKAERELANLCYYARQRGPLVIEAYVAWFESGKRCRTPDEYDLYSTNDRDASLKDYFIALHELTQNQNYSEVSEDLRRQIDFVFSESDDAAPTMGFNGLPNLNPNQTSSGPANPSSEALKCQIQVGVPQKPQMNLHEVWEQILNNKLISDPNATVQQRWGLAPFSPTCAHR